MLNKSIFLLSILLFSNSAWAERALVLARAPQLSADVMSQLWAPFVQHISKTTGIKIRLKVYTKRADFEKDIVDGNVDLYFGNPGYGIVGHLRHGYVPLIRSDKKLLKGIVVVKKDSGIKTVEQLENQVIAFPAETAFAASLYLRSILKSDSNLNFKPIYAGSHDNAYRTVLIGQAAAAGGVSRTLQHEPPERREQLQVIYTTPGMKSHPLMASPDILLSTRKSIQKAIIDLDKDATGKKLLKSVKLQKPVIANYVNDYQSIELLGRKMYNFLLD